ncbi:MAG: hypothetical protein KDM81_10885 [Verrucomicrobiae bacterium]|nr:hypothetical protein [Verrucomicrobiae bacterium]
MAGAVGRPARPGSTRPVFHERAGSRAADADVAGVGAQTQTQGQRLHPPGSRQPEGLHDPAHNYPLPNLFVSMLQRMGLETDRFATASGTMRGLEIA